MELIKQMPTNKGMYTRPKPKQTYPRIIGDACPITHAFQTTWTDREITKQLAVSDVVATRLNSFPSAINPPLKN